MAGMSMVGSSIMGYQGNRTVVIDVTGVCRQDVSTTSNYQLKVPYSQMSRMMSAIHRMGGKVAGVTIVGAEVPQQPTPKAKVAKAPKSEPKAEAAEAKPAPKAEAAE